MLYSLDLSLFKKGFSIKQFNCIDIPICAAVGYTAAEYYYLTAMLLTLRYNRGLFMELHDEYERQDGLGIYAKCLDDLGFSLNSETVRDKETWLAFVAKHLSCHEPVLLAVQYRALYYSIYYRDPEGERYHLLLIDRYHSDNGIITVRDSSVLNTVKLIDSDACVMFPVSVKEHDAWAFWEESERTKTDHYLGDYQMFFVRRERPGLSLSGVFGLFEQSLQKEESRLALYVRSFNERPDYFADNYPFLFTRFVGSISGLFHALRYFCERDNIDSKALADMEETFVSERKKILNRLTKYAVKKQKISAEKLDALANQTEQCEETFFSEIAAFVRCHFSDERSMDSFSADLSEFFNNKAAEDHAEPLPDISGTGICFSFSRTQLKQTCSMHPIRYDLQALLTVHASDNVSCCGQHIPVPQTSRRICILACAEYGSFEESLVLLDHGAEAERIPLAVSDFYMAPVFDENTFFSGKTFQREHGEVRELNFTSKIFEYSLPVSAPQFDEIVLPNRKNIHIFAITFLS